MKIRTLIFCACAALSTNIFATFRPIASITAGTDLIGFNMNQNVTLTAPFQNNYNTNSRVYDFIGGLFIGAEAPISGYFSGQLGVSFYRNENYNVQGSIFQFADPTLNDTGYQYYIQSQRLYVETKILTSCQEKYHPYFTVGIGEAINKAYQYHEIALTSSSVPMVPGFGDHTTHSFTYLLGIGLDIDITAHTRLGGMYRYSRLGNARLNTSPLEEGTQTLQNNAMHVNEFLFQFSYLG